MKTSEWLTLIGILVTLWAIHATTSAAPSPRLRRSRQWAGSGVDPFGASYTVEKQATAGGL